MDIQFDQIPGSIRKPGKYFEINKKLATSSLPQNRQKLLLIGQRTSGGTVAEKIITEIISDTQAAEYFGPGSQLHLMARAALSANKYVALWGIALDDAAAGVAASGTVTIDGAATASGSLTLWVGYQKVEIAITSAEAAADIAAALNAAINAKTSLPVTSTVSTSTVTLTAKNDGTQGNNISLLVETANSCVASTVVAMASGATDPTLNDALTVVAPDQSI